MRRALLVFVTCCLGLMPAEISHASFRHHFIKREMPGGNVGFGASVLADLDRDGDLDFTVLDRADRKLYWFEKTKTEWVRHAIGELPMSQLGGAVTDVDAAIDFASNSL